MASNQAPVVDRIRIIPRPDDFLDRNFGNSGEVFFDKQSNTLRLYSGKVAGGFTVLTSGNIAEHLSTSGVGTVEYQVTVGVDPDGIETGNKYFIDGEYKPQLNLVVGYTYIFNQNDSTNEYFPNLPGGDTNQHPLNFSADNVDGELGGGTVYEENVVYKLDDDPVTKDQYWTGFAAATSRSVQITVTSSTPSTLYYWCQQHTGMGNIVETANPGTGGGGASVEVSLTAPSNPQSGNIWLDSSSGKLYVYVQDDDSNQWIQPSVPVADVNAFSSVTVSDSTQIYATGSDTLNFVGGPGIVVSTDSTQNTVVIEATGSGGGGSSIGNFSFANSVIDTDDSSGITITPSVTTQSDLTVENDLIVRNRFTAKSVAAETLINNGIGPAVFDSGSSLTLSSIDQMTLSSGSTLTLSSVDGIVLDGLTILDSTTENFVWLGDDLAAVTHICDLSSAGVFYAGGAATDFTVNITNVPTENTRATSVAIIVAQGGLSSGLPLTLQIDGAAQTINWESGITPTSATSVTQVVSFTLIRYASGWNVIGSMTSYG